MEGGGSSNSSSSGSGSSRWNPTKEQISMLENLYKQGIRTPSAEQIQHITARLRAYGHIEGKNVFYWFQNHKARQRQKQKQDTIAYFNRFLHHQYPPPPHHSLLLPPSPNPANVVCAPYYLPHCEMGYYPQHQRLLLPGRMPPNYDHSLQVQVQPPQQTLPLFPLHPTGILEPKPIDSASENHPPFFDFLSSSTQDLNK